MTTFSITVELVDPVMPMNQEAIMDYILLRLESQDVLRVTNIVRDY